MINKIYDILVSMKTMVVLILVFALSIGTATIIENDFGTEAAKTMVYNADWFSVLLLLLLINLVGNIFKYKLFRKQKWTVFLFHISFIIILLGSALTRYIGYEGMMHIRQGKSSDQLITAQTFIQVKVDDQKNQYIYDKPILLNPLYNKPFDQKFDFKEKKVEIKSLGYYKSGEVFATDQQADGVDILELVTSDGNGRNTRFLKKGETIFIGQTPFSFDAAEASHLGFIINESDSGLVFKTVFPVKYMSMDDRSTGQLSGDTSHYFKNRHLYTVGGINLVLKNHHKKGVLDVRPGKKETPVDIIKLEASVDGEKTIVLVKGGKGFITPPKIFPLGGLNFRLGFGSKSITIPFSIYLDKFELERYPGSSSPASYASEVVLVDKVNDFEKKQRIYMNHVLDYDGYRFFQSSYDRDEKGTILSVNHDAPGTFFTYIGYFLMSLGMFLTLFKSGTRFRNLQNKLNKITKTVPVIIALIMISGGVFAQHQVSENAQYARKISKEHAAKFGHLLIQDRGGRIKPVNTLTSKFIRKLSRKEKFEGLNSDQLILSMMTFPDYWQAQPMIKVSHEALKERFHIEDKYVSIDKMFSKDYKYILATDVEEVNRKKARDRSKLDKDILAVDERMNIAYMIYTGSMLRLFPDSASVNHDWYTERSQPFPFHGIDSLFVKTIMPMYLDAVESATKSGDWSKADEVLGYINTYQQRFGGNILPSKKDVNLEITYNKTHVFKYLFEFYGLIGFIMLIVIFISIFRNSKALQVTIKSLKFLLLIGYIAHTAGLIARWYISGHAPWSNAYESMVFIAWTTMLAGFIFSRKSNITLAVTSILASLILMVAHLNWMDPEITNLVPVLNSYWLMIHVAIITSSYGFLGLGALLAFFNLWLMIFKNEKNKGKLNAILEELTIINEMTLETGLFLLTVGTFLGGVWANESWGRYWGWDAKETWALVTVLVYVAVVHFRFIPKLKGQFVFNTAALVAYSSVIMTYFGVNYYLSGLHSYAAGDPIPIPVFVYYTIAIIAFVIGLAFYKNNKTKPA